MTVTVKMVKEVEPVADIALIGLAVMGQNLILNMNDHGFVVCAYNRTVEKVDAFLNNEAKGTKVSVKVDAKRHWEPFTTLQSEWPNQTAKQPLFCKIMK